MNNAANIPMDMFPLIDVLREPIVLLRLRLEDLRMAFYVSATEFRRVHLAMNLMSDHPELWAAHELLRIAREKESIRLGARALLREIQGVQHRISRAEVEFIETMRTRGVLDAVLMIMEPDQMLGNGGEGWGNLHVEDDDPWNYRPGRRAERAEPPERREGRDGGERRGRNRGPVSEERAMRRDALFGPAWRTGRRGGRRVWIELGDDGSEYEVSESDTGSRPGSPDPEYINHPPAPW